MKYVIGSFNTSVLGTHYMPDYGDRCFSLLDTLGVPTPFTTKIVLIINYCFHSVSMY